MSSTSTPAMLPKPLEGRALIGYFFGESCHAETVMKETLAILAVEPIMQARATIYIPSAVSAFLWHRFLTTYASYQATDEPFGSSYSRFTDRKSVRVELIKSGKISFFATHEICLITSKTLYCPFSSTSRAKKTIACGPLRGRWQTEELDSLRRQGWSVYHYAGGELLDHDSNLELKGELSLHSGRLLLDEHSTVDDGLISTSTELTVRDDTGIEVDFFGCRF